MTGRQIEAIYPLSPLQQGMLYHSLLAPGEPVYVVQFACQLRGPLDAEAFARAWEALIARHAVLRTAFVWEGVPEPLQVVKRRVPTPVRRRDWRRSSPASQQQRLETLCADDRRAAFDLAKAPLLRIWLIRTGDEEHQFVWTHHHILFDGWSRPLLLREWLECYEAACAGASWQPPAPRPFSDYIAWLGQSRDGDDETFWRRTLRGASAFALPVARPAAAVDEANQSSLTLSLTEAESADVTQMARSRRLAPATTFAGAWALLLHRYSGLGEVMFGLTVAGRSAAFAGAETMVGLFINTVPLRVRVEAGVSVAAWLSGLQALQAAMREHDHTPLASIQQWMGAPGQPLFDSVFVFERVPADPSARTRSGGLRLEVSESRGQEHSNYPLTLVVLPGAIVSLRVDFDPRRHAAPIVSRMLEHLRTLLVAMAQSPDAPLATVSMLGPEERARIEAWGEPRGTFDDGLIHERFERQVAAREACDAVRCGGRSITYGELNARANQLARALLRLGVGPESRVAVCAHRSPELVIALLAVLKAGAAYVPLDPRHPPERLALVQANAGASVLLAHTDLQPELDTSSVPFLPLDEAWEAYRDEATDDVHVPVRAMSAAYVIYTSGSTGTPKGVVITHANVTRLLTATDAWTRFVPDDVWTLFHSSAFDFSVWEMWGCLLSGGRLVIVPYDISRSPDDFHELLCREGVTVLNQTPSAFYQLMEADARAAAPAGDLRLVIFGGEALDPSALAPWFARHGDERPALVNMYGITETTVHVTWRRVRAGDVRQGSRIGTGIPDLELRVLNASGDLLPAEVEGELFVGGSGLARGYLGRPALTAERFVPHPWPTRPGERLYRTGDRVRWCADGDLEFRGRVDTQIKIRGHRIEPGEVEAALRACDGVTQAVVIARERAARERVLVAYIVSTAAIDVPLLRRQLSRTLPEHAVPALFVRLDQLPLNANRKVDRARLPEPETARPTGTRVSVPPRTAVESALTEIWSEVLRVSPVGIEDNYFDLGGDSIRSIQLRAKAAARGLEFTLQQLLQYQTIADLAPHVTLRLDEPRAAAEPFSLIAPADRRRLSDDVVEAYPLTQLQAGMLFHSEYTPESSVYHDIFSFTVRAPFESAALVIACQETVERHPALRTSFDLTTFSEPLQIVHRFAMPAVTIEDLRSQEPSRQEAALAAWMAAGKARRLDWTRAPLFSITVHRRTDETFQFTLSMHHAMQDGWSLATMLTELFQRYLGRVAGGSASSQPPPPRATFGEYVALERAALQSDECRDYWMQALHGRPGGDLPRLPGVERGGGRRVFARQVVPVTAAVSDGLTDAARLAGVPLKSLLLAVHVHVMSVMMGRSRLVTGLVSHGRAEETDAERVLGLFLNTVPLAVDRAEGSWVALARRLFEAERTMLPYRRYPLSEIQRRLGGAPLFETAFTFAHFHVYQALAGVPSLTLLGGTSHDETNFTLLASFLLSVETAQVQLRLDHDAAALAPAQVAQLATAYGRALAAAAADPYAPVESCSLLADAERHQLCEGWNATDAPLRYRDVTELVAAQAARTPRAVAVMSASGSLTYAELMARADRLAGQLQALGIRPEQAVGIYVGRCLEMPVAVLGTLRAGATYVPLDPTYPSSRIALMIEDAGVRALVTEPGVRAALPASALPTIVLDLAAPAPAVVTRALRPDPDRLAYILYTSGSTGRPKAIGLPHRALVNLIEWHGATLGGPTRIPQFASIGFDASFHELFAAWHTGGCACLLSEAERLDLGGWDRLLRQRGIDRAILPVGALQQLAEHHAAGGLPETVTDLIATGETLRLTGALRALFERAPYLRLHNHYGPSETHVVTAATLEGPAAAWPADPPIGGPIWNTRIYLLDAAMQPTPIGTPGELYIGGVSLARGYLGRPGQTARAFVPSPFGTEAGARLYRTGDLARWLPDGTIAFLGRRDRQLKMRGFRIEPAEIQAALALHPAVREAIVVPHVFAADDTRLVAYLVTDPEPPGTEALRAFLAATLPAYMVPSAFIVLEALPVTTNGKVDYARLPAPDLQRSSLRAPYVAPATPAERLLADLWARVLRVSDIGRQDHFFELGGHSLLAMRAIARIREIFRTDLPVRSLFEHPTVEGMVAALAQVWGSREVVEEIAATVLAVDQLPAAEVIRLS